MHSVNWNRDFLSPIVLCHKLCRISILKIWDKSFSLKSNQGDWINIFSSILFVYCFYGVQMYYIIIKKPFKWFSKLKNCKVNTIQEKCREWLKSISYLLHSVTDCLSMKLHWTNIEMANYS